MSDTLTGRPGDVASNIPDYPMARAAGCPLAPAPVALELNAVKPLSRVRIWDGSTPWLITGYDAIRSLFTDSRASVDDRKPGYPHWNEGMLATVAQAAALGIHRRCRGAHHVSAHAVQAVHLQAGRGLAAGRPEDHRRPHRRDTGRPTAGRSGRHTGAAGPVAGDQSASGRAVFGRRVLPGAGQSRDGPLRERRGVGRRCDRAGQIHRQAGSRQNGKPDRRSGGRPRRAGQRRGAQCPGGGAVGHRRSDRRTRDHRQHDQPGDRCAARAPRPVGAVARHRRLRR